MVELDNQWAWSQVEAMADRSLSAGDERRMRAAMALDPRLRDAIARAATLRRELRHLKHVPVPVPLPRRLLNIPSRSRRSPTTPVWLAASVVGAASALVIALVLLMRISTPTDAQVAAVQEFEIAMTYLRRSAAIARDEVTASVGGGLREALAKSRDAVQDGEIEGANGG